jgi:hypothetical protein
MARRIFACLLAAGALAAALSLAVAPAAVSAATGDGEGAGSGERPVDDAVPDLVIGGAALAPAGAVEGLAGELEAVHGVSWVAIDQSSTAGPRLVVGFEAGAGDDPLPAVEAVIARQAEPAGIALAGRGAVDRELKARIGRGTLAAVILATLAAWALVTVLAGWARGALAGSTVALAGWLGATLGARAAGPFDGSIVTTSVPAALAAIVVSGCLVLRLVSWYETPQGEDQADMIRRAVASLAAELILFFAGLVVMSVFLEWIGDARSVATVILVGALTAALLTLAVVPAALAGLHDAGAGAGPLERDGEEEDRLLPFSVPNGQDFPVLVLAVFGFLLGCLSLFAFEATSRSQVMDERSLSDRGTATVLADELAAGGDPTNAVLAVFPDGADQQARIAWIERVSQLTSVARIDTPVGRFELGELTSAPGTAATTGEAGTAVDATGSPSYALVVLRVPGRSEAAQDLVAAVQATNPPVNAELSGVPVDAVFASQHDSLTVWATILALAAIAGVAVFTLVGDVVLGILAAGLRLLGSTAVIGAYHLLVAEVSGSELQLAAIIIAMGIGLFELGFLRRLLVSHRVEDTDLLLQRALGSEGRAAAFGLGLVAVASVGLAFTSLGLVRRLAIVLIVGIVIEVVVGAWLLRPGLLGSRAITHFASQPVRTALRALAGGSTGEIDHQSWASVVDYLLQAELRLQADPGPADLDAVYLPGTELHHQADEHHKSLAGAGLRVVGRSPQLRSLRVVSGTDPVTVAATVDHPVRQLVSRSGKVVGVRQPERRSVMLWLVVLTDGSCRIADSVELGAMPLAAGNETAAEVAPALGVSLE